MSRILLADDSPHAQRMGERILREEGFEVVSVTDGETALVRLADADPDVVLADVFLPLRSGYEICQYVKSHPRHRHARVVLLAGLLEPVDETAVTRVGADAVLKKPFEASAVVALVRPMVEAAQAAREVRDETGAAAQPSSTAETTSADDGPVVDTAAPEQSAAVAGAAPAEPAEPQTAAGVSPAEPAEPDTAAGVAPAEPAEPDTAAGVAPVEPAETDTAAGVIPAEPAEPDTAAGVAPVEPAETDTAAGVIPAEPAEPDTAAGVAPVEPAETDHAELAAPIGWDPRSAVDAERVRAAVTVALDRAMPAMIDEITERVLVALGQ